MSTPFAIVWAHLPQQLPFFEIATIYCVSEHNEMFQSTGDVQPQSRRYGPHSLLGELKQMFLFRLKLKKLLYEIQEDVLKFFSVTQSANTVISMRGVLLVEGVQYSAISIVSI